MTMDPAKFEDWQLYHLRLAPATVRAGTAHLRWMVDHGLEIHHFTTERGNAWIAQRLRDGATPYAVNGDVRVLNRLHVYLHGSAPFLRQKPPRSAYKHLSPGEVRAVLAYRHKDPETERLRRALVLAALKFGMRSSELAAMNLTDLDQERSRFFVRRPAKRGQQRWCPVEPWVYSPKRPLGAYISWRMHHPAEADPQALWVVRPDAAAGAGQRARGAPQRLSQAGLRKALREVGKATGVRLNCTVTRHTRGTELSDAGWGAQFIKTYLGHANIASTMIYVEVRDTNLNQLMSRKPGRDFFGGRA